jgi:DNA replication protein DnaC
MNTATRAATSSRVAVQRVEVSAELRDLMRRLKLGRLLDTLPERLALARQSHLPHHEFLEMLLADEVTRRDRNAVDRRAREANLDPCMVLEAWDDSSAVAFDRALWAELCSLRFLDSAHNLMVLGPVGVGKTFLANALGHAAVRRRYSVHLERADKLFKRLRAARLDHSHDEAMGKLHRVQLLILDDVALHPLGVDQTNDFYELIVERHRQHSTIITSNREGPEILSMMADQMLGQSALDRLQSAAFELVVEGESYRQRQRPLLARDAQGSR